MKSLHCSDAGFDCQAVVKAATTEEVLQQAAAHAQQVHGVAVTPEMAEVIRKLIKEEA
jgi:predicted small metal-binding protein